MGFNSDVAYEGANEAVENQYRSPFDNHYYVEGIRHGKREVLDNIYSRYFTKIKAMVVKNSGSLEDARDVFQEALIAIYRNSQKPAFQLTCRFDTYLYAISRNLWFLNLRKKNIQFTTMDDVTLSESVEDLEETVNSIERYQLYKRMFAELGEQCRKLLLLFMEGTDMKTIASEMGFASESYAKKRKFKCKEQLIAKITKDKDYKRIKTRG